MTDISDRASQIEQLQRDIAIKQRIQNPQSSSPYCEDCGNDIPLERLKAVMGCVRCIDCQIRYEKVKRNYRR